MNSQRNLAGQTGRINPIVGLAAAAAVVAILAVTSSPTGRSTLAEAVPATQAAPSAAERPAYFPDGFPPPQGEIEPHIDAF
jgi:hypothetical protein